MKKTRILKTTWVSLDDVGKVTHIGGTYNPTKQAQTRTKWSKYNIESLGI